MWKRFANSGIGSRNSYDDVGKPWSSNRVGWPWVARFAVENVVAVGDGGAQLDRGGNSDEDRSDGGRIAGGAGRRLGWPAGAWRMFLKPEELCRRDRKASRVQ
jgi:hypothetical protein